MNLEQKISNKVDEVMQSGVIEKAIEEHIKKAVDKVLDDLLGSWGDGTKIIEKKLKEVMIPQIEKYDYSQYIIKLDSVLRKILKNTTLDNKKILKNFKEFCLDNVPKEINTEDIFKKYCDYVSKNIKTDELEIEEERYVDAQVNMEIEYHESRDWSSYEEATIFLECEEDKNLNKEIKIIKWKDDNYWTIEGNDNLNLTSLRTINEFDIFIMKINQNYTHINIDIEDKEDYIEIEEEPELTYE